MLDLHFIQVEAYNSKVMVSGFLTVCCSWDLNFLGANFFFGAGKSIFYESQYSLLMTFWLPAVWSHCFPIFLPGVLFIYVGTESVSLIQHCYFGICSRRAYLHPQPRLGTSSDVLPWRVCSHLDFKRRQSEATLMFTSESVMRYLDSCFWPTVWRHAGVTKHLALRLCSTGRQSRPELRQFISLTLTFLIIRRKKSLSSK